MRSVTAFAAAAQFLRGPLTLPPPPPPPLSRDARMGAAAGDAVCMEVLGSSGYAGVELLRLLASHPRAEVAALARSDRNASNGMGDVFA
jgi:Semialdehyde dehydrogenase, NAD binding domain